MDIPEAILLGNKMIKIERPCVRRLISQKTEVKKRYVKSLNKFYEYHDLGNKIKRVNKEKRKVSKLKLYLYLNQLDKLCTAGMKHAERNCCKLHMGEVPYFPGSADKVRN